MDPRHVQLSPDAEAVAPLASGLRPRVFDKMESLIREMQDPENGVPVRSQKLFLTSIPSAFMGYDMVEWLMERLNIEDSAEAIHVANLLCQHGYFFPVGECKNLVVKDDSSLYRFQTPYFWPSQNHNPDNTEYAVYLYKRSIRNKQKHGLEDYEVEALNRLKKTLAHKWDFIGMQAEEQVRLAKDRKKGDKIVTDSQERAYWRAYRPPPGYFNCLELPPVPLASGSNADPRSVASPNAVRRRKTSEDLKQEAEFLRGLLNRARTKVSQAVEALQQHCSTYAEFDPLLTPPQPSNPWLSDDATYWILNNPIVETPTEKRVKRWAISMEDLVADQTGLQELTNYLRKEYSHENIRFWLAAQEMRTGPASRILTRVQEIYSEFLAPGAPCEINIDGRTMEKVQHEIKSPSRFTFDAAAEHVYNLLLKKDCYPRFVRSDYYKQLLANAIQPCQKKRFFSFGAPGKKKMSTVTTPQTLMQPSGIPSSMKRRGSDRSLSGSPPEGTSGSGPYLGSSQNTGSGGSGEECETPYRGDMPGLRIASAPIIYGQNQGEGSGESAEKRGPADDVCPWETIEPPNPPRGGRSPDSSRYLTAAPSGSSSVDLDSISPGKVSRASVESNPSTDLDICPWEAAPPPATVIVTSAVLPAPVVIKKQTSIAKKSVEEDVCPWEASDSSSSSVKADVTVVTLSSPQVRSSSKCEAVDLRAEPAQGSVSNVSDLSADGLKSLQVHVDVCPWDTQCPSPGPGGGTDPSVVASRAAVVPATTDAIVDISSVVIMSADGESKDLKQETKTEEEDTDHRTSSDKAPNSVNLDYSVTSGMVDVGLPPKPVACNSTVKLTSASPPNAVCTWDGKPPAKISDICPWEDEETCKVDQPFVKTYATLGYL